LEIWKIRDKEKKKLETSMSKRKRTEVEDIYETMKQRGIKKGRRKGRTLEK